MMDVNKTLGDAFTIVAAILSTILYILMLALCRCAECTGATKSS